MRLRLDHPLVTDFIENSAGENAIRVVRCLDKGRTDEQISKRTKLRVNDVRAMLNRLHCLGIISYSKEKAKESNWYTYTWFLKKDRITELLAERYEEETEKLQQKLGFEQNYVFFKCKNGCEKLPFELAYEYNFKCPDCGGNMEEQNNVNEKRVLEKKLVDIRKLLGN